MNLRSMLAVVAVASVATGSALLVTAPVEAAGGCNVAAAKPWKPFQTEAFANGPSCELAVATLVIRGADRKVLYTTSSAAEHIMTLAGAKTPKEMAKALNEWLDSSKKSSAELPPWKKGAEAPAAGEFPFYPDVDWETYNRIRSEKQAMFCYVQGMESEACVAISRDGSVEKVGVQTFPG